MFDIISSSSSSTETTVTYYNLNKIQCEKCNGSGYQQRDDGIFVICPICDGTGWREQKLREKCVPYYPSPWCPSNNPSPWYPANNPYPWSQPMYDVTC